ncbi:hypothetical protein JIQ42_02183 [Leishmania sp. Namibia]|uniref:hypothetical protein n=1 Tax=Leishmania sp. Namibia TaxID=2802991 RepID=UPI001B47D5CF|nr:hypothetical protein JIQ42_02183 [Leishmania sp. Namibia]
MYAEGLHHTPSVRTSSSHRSTIETRGVPEFDREYARQLSIAKRGRNSSVKATQLSAPAQELPSESQLHGSAALAASRLKDYVATHVTPPRIPPLSSITRSSEHDGKSVGPRKPETAHDCMSKTLATSTRDEEVTGSTTPLVLNSTRCGSSFLDADSPTVATDGDGNLLLFPVKTLLFIVVVFFTVLCATAFVVSASTDYNPSYFSFSRESSTPRARLRDGIVVRRGWPDRLVPEFHRQVALHARLALWELLSCVGVPSAFRFLGSVLAATKAYVWDPVYTILPRIDDEVPPVLRYITSIATGCGEGRGFRTVTTLAASVVHSVVQLVVEPLLILGRTAQALYRWLGGSQAFFSTPLKSLHAAAVNSSSAVTTAKANRTFVTTRAGSSALLSLWKPLHALCGVFVTAASLADTPAPGNHSTSAARMTDKRATPASSPPSPKIEKTPSTTSTKAAPHAIAAHVEVRTTHTHRLEGALWSTLLDTRRDEMEGLARDDVWELLRVDGTAAREVEVALRAGSLVMDIVVSSQAVVQRSSGTGDGDTEKATGGMETTRRTRQAAIDARLQQWHFPRLRAFYSRAASAAETQRVGTAHAAAAVAACESRVAACQKRCASIQHGLELELQGCTSGSSAPNVSWLSSSEEATNEVSAQLRNCIDELTQCRASFPLSTPDPAGQERRLLPDEGATREAQVALAAPRQAAAGAVSASAVSATHSEAERQRCTARLAMAAQKCEQRVRDTRSLSDAEHAKQLASLKEECDLRHSAVEKALSEKANVLVQQAEATCGEQLATRVAVFNESADSALAHLQRALDATRAEGAKRVAACMGAAEEAQASFRTERAQLNASCVMQLSSVRRRCAAELAAQGEEARRASAAAAQKAEAVCTERLVRELSTLNSSATAAASKLQRELEEARRGAVACEKAKQQTMTECGVALQRTREEFDAQLSKARENSTAAAQQARDEEREAQLRISLQKWRLEKEQLAAQCAAETQAAVTAASHQLAAKHAKAQEEAVSEEQRRTATQLRQREEACQMQSETVRRRHEEQVRDLGAQITSCRAELVGVETAHQQTAQKARQAFYAAVAESAKEACLEVAHRQPNVCADVSKAVEEELLKLPVDASATDALKEMLKSTLEPARLTWRLSGRLAHALKDGEPAAARGARARFTSSLRVSGVLVALLASAFVLAKYPRGRRLSDDPIARPDTLMASRETSMAVRTPPTLSPRSRRNRARHRGDALAAGEAPLSCCVMQSCMANCSEALLAWHATCCAVLWEREAHVLRGHPSEVNEHCATWMAGAFTSLESLVGNLHAPSVFQDALGRSPVLASTLPITREDAECLSQLHAAFAEGYFGMLEMYYVDWVSAAADREVAESRLQEAERVAVSQAATLQRQSLTERQKPPSPLAIKDKLAKAERRSAAQEETIALLEKQLRITRDELNKARGAIYTPAPSLRTALEAAVAVEPASSAPRQARSLQELAEGGADSDSFSACDCYDAEREPAAGGGPNPPHLLVSAQSSPTLLSAMKRSTMVRDPDSTRHYHRLQWNDVDMT